MVQGGCVVVNLGNESSKACNAVSSPTDKEDAPYTTASNSSSMMEHFIPQLADKKVHGRLTFGVL